MIFRRISSINTLACAAVATTLLGAGLSAHAEKDGQITTKLALEPSAFAPTSPKKLSLGYMPMALAYMDAKPTKIKKEPTYTGTVKYAEIHAGNGPKSTTVVAIDQAPDGDWKVYVDKNQNGDLTDDGDAVILKKVDQKGRTLYGVGHLVVRASWGSAKHETSHGDYGLGIYAFATGNTPTKNALIYREGARTGQIKIAGKKHAVLLAENDADAVYSKTVETDADGKPVGKITSRPVWLIIDLKDTGKFSMADSVDTRAPFKLGETVYEAKVSDDGYKLTLKTTTKVAAELVAKPKPLLASGTAVPDFKAVAWGGASVQPANYKGKVLIVDFWATWCGPCQASMPHLEKVYQAVKGKNVDVVAICVWDEKAAYEKWVPANQSKYSFPLAFDPAGNDTPNSIAAKLFHVNGIPTTYIIGSDGKIIDSVVGYDSKGDHRLEDALKKAGVEVTVAEETPEKAPAVKLAKTIPATAILPANGSGK